MRKFLRITPIVLGVIVLLGFIIPILFKDRIITELKKSLNKNINGNIEFKNAEVSVFKNFPKLTLTVEDFICKSYVFMDTTQLLHVSEIQLGFNIWSIIKDRENLIIKKIILKKPIINLVEYDSLHVNYNIFKPTDTDPSTSKGDMTMDVESYDLIDGTLKYSSIPSGMEIALNQIYHKGSLNYSDEATKIKAVTEIKDINYQKNLIGLLKSANLNSNLELDYINKSNLFYINKGEFNLNNLKLECTGSFGSIGDSILMDLTLKAPNNKFKDIFSILPYALTKDFDQARSEGTLQLNAEIGGVYSEKLNMYPSWNFICNIENGLMHYPGKSIQLQDFNLNLVSNNTGPSLNNALIDIQTFSFLLNKQSLNGKLKFSDIDRDFSVEGLVKGMLNLGDLNNFYPIDKNTKISGLIKPDLSFRFSKSAIVQKQFDKIYCDGSLSLNNIYYATLGQPDISVLNAQLIIDPKQLSLNDISMKAGSSDILMNGILKEPLNFISKDLAVYGNLRSQSKLLNLNEWNNDNAKDSDHLKKKSTGVLPEFISKLKLSVDCYMAQLIYEDYDIRDCKANAFIDGDNIKINQFSSIINQNQLNGSGSLFGVFSYAMTNKILSGNLKLASARFDADRFLADANSNVPVKSNQDEKSKPFLVPENFNITIGFTAAELLYKPLILNNVFGNISLVSNELQFKDLKANLAGGKIAMKGIYNSSNALQPFFNMKMDILKLPFSEAITSFTSLNRLAPVMKYIQGYFNSNLILEGIVGSNMIPVLENINVDGLFETLEGSIQGFKPLDLLAEKLKIKELKNLNIGNTKNWVTVKNGIIGIKDFNKKIADIDLNINGNHNLVGLIDYQFILKIPKNKVAQFTSALKLDRTVDQLNNILSKAGLGGNVLTNINLLVNMTGTITKPAFSFKLLNSKGDIAGEEETILESVKTKIVDTIKSKVESEIDKLKDKANQEVKRTQDSIRKAAIKKAEELKDKLLEKSSRGNSKTVDSNRIDGKNPSDSLSSKVLNKDAKKEVDQIKDKINDWNPFKKEKK